MSLLRRVIKPKRDLASRDSHRLRWWQYGEVRPGLIKAIEGKKRVIVCPQTGKHLPFAFLPAGIVYNETLKVFGLDTFSAFSILQSRVHEIWARFFGSSLEDRLRYTPTDCFETFPFPLGWQINRVLEQIGERYYEYRAELMRRTEKGLTETYNRFHNKFETDVGIAALRQLHAELDLAVLNAYGWTDLQPRLEFVLDYENEEDDESLSSDRQKPWRYRWVDDDRDEVLARLLELNRIRAEEEAQSAAAPSAKTLGRRSKKSTKNSPVASPNLFEVQEPTE